MSAILDLLKEYSVNETEDHAFCRKWHVPPTWDFSPDSFLAGKFILGPDFLVYTFYLILCKKLFPNIFSPVESLLNQSKSKMRKPNFLDFTIASYLCILLAIIIFMRTRQRTLLSLANMCWPATVAQIYCLTCRNCERIFLYFIIIQAYGGLVAVLFPNRNGWVNQVVYLGNFEIVLDYKMLFYLHHSLITILPLYLCMTRGRGLFSDAGSKSSSSSGGSKKSSVDSKNAKNDDKKKISNSASSRAFKFAASASLICFFTLALVNRTISRLLDYNITCQKCPPEGFVNSIGYMPWLERTGLYFMWSAISNASVCVVFCFPCCFVLYVAGVAGNQMFGEADAGVKGGQKNRKKKD